MAARNALVLISGVVREMPAGDSLNGAGGSVGDHAVRVDTGNGMGSTSTKIRRFTTTSINVGTAITYADSSTAGATFTINETGIYSVFYSDVGASGNSASFGISVNSSQLTTSIGSITAANRLVFGYTNGALEGTASGVFRFSSGDVVRPHNGPLSLESSNGTTTFYIRKVGT